MSTPHVPRSDGRSRGVRWLYRLLAWIYEPLRRWWSRRTADAEKELDVLFAKRIGATSRILELGPGTGINIERLYRVCSGFGSYLGIDLSKEMLARAKRKAAGDPRVELRLGDICELSAVEGGFDFVVSTWVLSHLEQPETTVRDALARLAPGGTAVFLFATKSRAGILRAILQRLWPIALARIVDPEPLLELPGFERRLGFDASLGAAATLLVYKGVEAEPAVEPASLA